MTKKIIVIATHRHIDIVPAPAAPAGPKPAGWPDELMAAVEAGRVSYRTAAAMMARA